LKTVALYNVKGGVGKTASSVNLAYLAAKDGFRTLLCDLDPQGSASYYFRIKPSKKFSAKKMLKGGRAIEKNIKGTDFENLDLLPSDLSYRNMDIALDDLKRSKKRLGEIMRPLKKEYDLVFLDCPPNITLLSENIFNAADIIVVPVIPTTLSIFAYKKLLEFFKEAKHDRTKIHAFFSMIERRKKLHRDIMNEMHAKHRTRFLHSQIPYAAPVEKMGIHRQPVELFQPRSAASKAYQKLWEEIKTAIA